MPCSRSWLRISSEQVFSLNTSDSVISKIQPSRVEASLLQYADNGVGQRGVHQLNRRNVDRTLSSVAQLAASAQAVSAPTRRGALIKADFLCHRDKHRQRRAAHRWNQRTSAS